MSNVPQVPTAPQGRNQQRPPTTRSRGDNKAVTPSESLVKSRSSKTVIASAPWRVRCGRSHLPIGPLGVDVNVLPSEQVPIRQFCRKRFTQDLFLTSNQFRSRSVANCPRRSSGLNPFRIRHKKFSETDVRNAAPEMSRQREAERGDHNPRTCVKSRNHVV